MDHLIKLIIDSNHPLVICPIDYKKIILKTLHTKKVLKHIAFFTEASFIEAHTFKKTQQLHTFLSDQYQIMPENTDEIISVLQTMMIYQEDSSPHFKDYFDIKNDAIEKNIIEIQSLDAQNSSIFLYGYPAPSALLLKILTTYKYQTLHEDTYQTPITFETLSDDISEARFIVNHIASLIHQGVSLNHIKIHLNQKDDQALLELMLHRYQIPYYLTEGYTLGHLHFMHSMIDDDILSLDTISESIEMIYQRLEKEIAYYKDIGSDILKTFLKVLNPYILLDGPLVTYKKQLLYDLSHARIPYPQTHHQVIIGNLLESYVGKNDHVFIIGFNANEIPRVYQNNTYFDDSKKSKMFIETSFDLTHQEKTKTLAFLNRVQHLYTTSKQTRQGKSLYPSTLFDTLTRPIQTYKPLDESIRYSLTQDCIDVSKHVYMYDTYHLFHPDLNLLYPTVKNHLAPLYESQLKPLNEFQIQSLLEKNSALSYTKLNTYFECPFKFLFQHLLKIDPFDGPTFSMYLGTFFHLVLKDYRSLPESQHALLETLTTQLHLYLEKEAITDLEYQFFFQESLTQLIEVIYFLREIDTATSLSSIQTEVSFEYPVEGKYIKKLTGIIDKIVTDSEAIHHAYLVDYKTGNSKKSLDYISSGLYAQLLFYLLFLMKRPNHPVILGFYYQNIFSKVLNQDKEKPYQELLRKEYQLSGYSHEDIGLVSQIDRDFQDRKTFANYRVNKDGTLYKNSWIYNLDTLNQTIEDFEILIQETIKKMELGQFQIEPVYLNGDFKQKVACEYCKFKDICYVKPHHFKNAPKDNPLMKGDTLDEDSE